MGHHGVICPSTINSSSHTLITASPRPPTPPTPRPDIASHHCHCQFLVLSLARRQSGANVLLSVKSQWRGAESPLGHFHKSACDFFLMQDQRSMIDAVKSFTVRKLLGEFPGQEVVRKSVSEVIMRGIRHTCKQILLLLYLFLL